MSDKIGKVPWLVHGNPGELAVSNNDQTVYARLPRMRSCSRSTSRWVSARFRTLWPVGGGRAVVAVQEAAAALLSVASVFLAAALRVTFDARA